MLGEIGEYGKLGKNVSFPDEAIRGINFFLAQVNSFPYITSGRRPRVIRK